MITLGMCRDSDLAVLILVGIGVGVGETEAVGKETGFEAESFVRPGIFYLLAFIHYLSIFMTYFNHQGAHSQHLFFHSYFMYVLLESYLFQPFQSFQTHHTNFYPTKRIYYSSRSLLNVLFILYYAMQ